MKKEDAKKLFGMNLRRLRLEKGMSQEELAKKLGYKGRSAINKIETGVNDMPREMVVKCAQALGCSPIDLFYYEQFTGDEEVYFSSKPENNVDKMVWSMVMKKESKSLQAILDETKSLPESKLQQILSYIKFLKTQEGET